MIKLKDQIEHDQIKAGEPLPTRERLMKEHGLSLSTVTRAITELERQGWLISRQGSGTFVVKRGNGEHEESKGQLVIGLLAPASEPSCRELATDLSMEVREYNAKLVVMYTPDDEESELNYARFLFEKGVNAVVWSPVLPKRHVGVASIFTKNKIPVIVCEKVSENMGPFAKCVTVDHYGGMISSLHHLYDLGHQRIAYVGPKGAESDFGPVPERWNAYKDSMKENNLWDPDDLVLSPNLFQEWRHHSKRIESMFQRPKGPTAIIACTDSIAVEAAQCLSALGYHIPEDISIIGNGDSIVSRFYTPRLTTVSSSCSEYVDNILRGLKQMLSKPDIGGGESDLTIPQRLIVRESTASPAKNMLAAG